jgi:hypothetical protein
MDIISLEQRFIVGTVRVGRIWRRIADAAASEFGLTEATARTLLYLCRMNEPPRQSTLAEISWALSGRH